MKQLNVRVDDELLRKFKIKLLEDDISAQDFVNLLIQNYIDNQFHLVYYDDEKYIV